MNIARAAVVTTIALMANVVAGAEQVTRPDMAALIQQSQKVTYFEEAAMSPDHRRVAWVQSVPHAADNSSASAIFMQSVDPNHTPESLSARQDKGKGDSAVTENYLSWSADSRSLAFLSDADLPGQPELYVYRLGDHSYRRMTSVKGTVSTPRWSPDGRKIALLFTENADRQAGPLVAVPAPTGVIEADIREQALVLVDVDTGVMERLTTGDRYVYEFDWSPGSDAIVATGAHGSGDNNWYTAELFTIDVATGHEHLLLKPAMQIAVPRWSPDGRSIAFVAGLMSDESVASGDVYVIPSRGGVARNLTPDLPVCLLDQLASQFPRPRACRGAGRRQCGQPAGCPHRQARRSVERRRDSAGNP